ncbi:MAG: glycosyltransferase, partial [Alphaproteobacteria bacterium]
MQTGSPAGSPTGTGRPTGTGQAADTAGTADPAAEAPVAAAAETAAGTPADTEADAALAARLQGLSLSVVIPAYNEEGAVAETVAEIRAALDPWPIDYEIIVVDDGSSDNTRAAAEATGVTVDANPVNIGYGAA